MQVGIRLIEDLGNPKELLRLAVQAETMGFDSVWFPHDAFRTHSWVLAAATAQATHRVQIHVRANPYTTDPSEVVTYLASLDLLSDGRANLSIGLHTTEMLDWIGLDGSDVVDRTREAYELVRSRLRGEATEYTGNCYQWTRHAYLRFPVLREDLPVYICAFGDKFLEISGQIGGGSIPMVAPPAAAPRIVSKILQGAARVGRKRDDFEVVAFLWISVDEDSRAAREALRPVIAYFGRYLDPGDLALVGLTPQDFDAVHRAMLAGNRQQAAGLVTDEMLSLGIAGTPEQCLEQLLRVVDAGVDGLSLGGPLGPQPERALRLIADHIMPALVT